MSDTPFWRRYLRFWGPDVDADVADELRFHLEQLVADYEARGLAPADARRAARDRFGDAAVVERQLRSHDRKQHARRQRLDRFRLAVQQLRVAARTLRRAPGFAFATVLTLALGIGFSTAVFDVASTLLLRPLPIRDEARVIVLSGRTRDGTVPDFPLPLEEGRAFVRSARTVERAALVSYYTAVPQPVMRGSGVVAMRETQVAGDFFSVLGARPALGRLLRDDDDVRGAAPVAVLSYDAWLRDFAGDTGVIGSALRVHGSNVVYTVVGVAARGLGFPARTDFWVPIAPSTPPGGESYVMVNFIARLAPGRTVEQASAELSAFYKRPDAPKTEAALAAVGRPLRVYTLGDTRPAVLVFAAAVALLLLITCMNVGSLMLVRGIARTPELAVRSALGARHRHLTAVLIAEAALLAGAGGTLGIAFGAVLIKAFVAVAPATTPLLGEIGVSGQTVVVALAVTTFALTASGVLPALRHARVDAIEVLRSGTQRSVGRSARRTMELLVAAQVALALTMLSAAALIGRSLLALERVDLGFDGSHLTVLELSLPPDEYTTLPQQIALLDRLVAAAEQIPGVVAASPVVAPPFAGSSGWDLRPVLEGQTPTDAATNPDLNVDVVTPAYFRALGTPLRRGRTFTEADRDSTPRVVVVSRSAADLLWHGNDPIGKRLTVAGAPAPEFTVVGIVDDTRYRELRAPRASIYFPLHQPFFPFAPTTLVVRTSIPPDAVIPALRRMVDRTAPSVAVARAQTFDDLLRVPLAQPRLNALLLVLFAMAAAVLASVGLFGVMATIVRQRTREIGVRLALGAAPRRVQRMIMQRGLAVALIGALAGCVGSLLLGRALGSLLYGVSPTDTPTLLGTFAALLALAGVAALLPARAAARVDPAVALRADT